MPFLCIAIFFEYVGFFGPIFYAQSYAIQIKLRERGSSLLSRSNLESEGLETDQE